MNKRLFVVFVLVAAFAVTGCATGGAYRSPLEQVTYGNSNMICRISGDVFVDGPAPFRGCLQDILRLGFSGSQLMGYSMFRNDGHSLSRAEKIAVLGAACAAVGGIITRDWKGAAIGGAVCAATTAVATRGRNDQPVAQSGQQSVRVIDPNVWGGASGRPNCLKQGLVTLRNITGEILAVFEEGADPENEDPLAVLQPRESRCGDPDLRYEAWVRQTAISANRRVGSTERMPRRPEARPGMVLVWR